MEAEYFLLGVSMGGLLMLFIMVRIIIAMHDRFGQNMRRR
jgi:alpha-beta hydrolase superfamily lysophospholipase